jgi:hypothetical protein
MHPNKYLRDASRVGLVGTLLMGNALAWFATITGEEILNLREL